MAYDYRKLRGRIIEKYGTLKDFAIEMNWSERTLSLKMNCKVFETARNYESGKAS